MDEFSNNLLHFTNTRKVSKTWLSSVVEFLCKKHPKESYPDDWLHCTIHLNPETGEMHSDGDHQVRVWIEERLLSGGMRE